MRAYWVERDVARELEPVRLLFDQDVLEACFEEVPSPLMPPVEALRVAPEEAVHAGREGALRSLDAQMVVIAHQTVVERE